MNGAYSLVLADPKGATGPVAFNMSKGELKPSRPIPIFTLLHNGEVYRDELGKPVEFVSREAADRHADDLAARHNSSRGCFETRRDWV